MPTENLLSRLDTWAHTQADKQALATPQYSLSFSELSHLVCAQANLLSRQGISCSETVAIECKDDVEHLILTLSVIRLGARSLSIPSFEPDESKSKLRRRARVSHTLFALDHTLRRSERMSGRLSRAKGHGENLEEPLKDPLKENLNNTFQDTFRPSTAVLDHSSAPPARLLFSTSGTTGDPKLVEFLESDLVAQAPRHIQSSTERFACLASMEHNFAKRHRLYCLAMGATNVFPDTSTGKLIEEILALQTNVLHVSAFQAQEILGQPDTSKLQGIRLKLGGSHIPLSLRQALVEKVTPYVEAGYGTTETGAIGFSRHQDTPTTESVGRPLPGIRLSIRDQDAHILGSGVRGEIWISGAGLFRSYFENPEATASRLIDGWFRTGDMGYLDEENRIHLCGRADDMFVFNTMNIYPQEIESLLCEFADIQEACVYPISSQLHGHIPAALIRPVTGQPLNMEKLITFIEQRAGLRRPRLITVVEALPRTVSGKVDRQAARKLGVDKASIETELLSCLHTQMKTEHQKATLSRLLAAAVPIPFDALELDSLARMELMIVLETKFGLILTPDTFNRLPTVQDLCSWVAKHHETNDTRANLMSTRPAHQDVTSPNASDQMAEVAPYMPLIARLAKSCATIAHFNQALHTLECRLTPADVEALTAWSQAGSHSSMPPAYVHAISIWLNNLWQQLCSSGKASMEAFAVERLTPTARLFKGAGLSHRKTLLICFCGRGGHQISIPNPVLAQHFDHRSHDLLIISEPRRESYRRGVPMLGNTIHELVDWFKNAAFISHYEAVETLGCSAGAYPAIVVGYALEARNIVSIGGRFHRAKQSPLRYLERLFVILDARLRGRCSRVVLSYSKDVRRDRRFAKVIALLTSGEHHAEMLDERKVHVPLPLFLSKGTLTAYLNRLLCNEAASNHGFELSEQVESR